MLPGHKQIKFRNKKITKCLEKMQPKGLQKSKRELIFQTE
jgi:hypothetical protein